MTARASLRTTDGPFTVDDFGSDIVVVSIDHGITDDKGRKVGGRAEIERGLFSDLLSVRIHATRDGIAFGALRKRTHGYATTADAIAAGKAKLLKQGERYRGAK